MSFIKLFWKKEEWLLEMNSLPDSASGGGAGRFHCCFWLEKKQKQKKKRNDKWGENKKRNRKTIRDLADCYLQ